jgi:hypothetical protein
MENIIKIDPEEINRAGEKLIALGFNQTLKEEQRHIYESKSRMVIVVLEVGPIGMKHIDNKETYVEGILVESFTRDSGNFPSLIRAVVRGEQYRN